MIPQQGIKLTTFKKFLDCFPTHKVIRVGKVNEYIFECGELNSLQLVSERFVKMPIPQGGEIRIRANFRAEDYNRILTIEPVKQMRRTGPHTPPEPKGFGVKVTVDFNNANLGKEMQQADWLTVLVSADLFVKGELFDILNGKRGDEIQ